MKGQRLDDAFKLRVWALWHEGHSSAEIGRRLNVTKNAIVGCARRIGCLPRKSPIIRDGGAAPKPPAPRKAIRATLPPLKCAGEVMPAAPPMVERTGFNIKPCCWPFGDPKERDFRFCGAPAAAGKPYCEHHTRQARGKDNDS